MDTAAFLSGWAGGFAGVLASHPLDTLRTRQAVSGQSARQAAKALIATGSWNLCESADAIMRFLSALPAPQRPAPHHPAPPSPGCAHTTPPAPRAPRLSRCFPSCTASFPLLPSPAPILIRSHQTRTAPCPRPPDAGVISPCVSVGAWKSVTLGLNHSLMQALADIQGVGGISRLPLWQVWGTVMPDLDLASTPAPSRPLSPAAHVLLPF